MYYEFYIDLYFLENLLMNYLLLRLTGEMAGCPYPVRHASQKEGGSTALADKKEGVCRFLKKRVCVWGRLAAASSFGAACACMIAVTPLHRNAFLSVSLSFLYGMAMLSVGYGVYGQAKTRALTGQFLLAALLLGGTCQFLMRYLPLHFFGAMPVGYTIVQAGMRLWRKIKNRTQYLYEVTILHGGRRVKINGLLDSGNQLMLPGSAQPVQILDFEVACTLLNEKEREELACMLRMEAPKAPDGKFRYIPYRSIGREHGILPVMMLDRVVIQQGEHVWDTRQTAAAISSTAVSGRGDYQMILHPQILK